MFVASGFSATPCKPEGMFLTTNASSDPEGADDADDNKPMKPAAEKRGRGRPAGAKSGARKITGTSKLMNK